MIAQDPLLTRRRPRAWVWWPVVIVPVLAVLIIARPMLAAYSVPQYQADGIVSGCIWVPPATSSQMSCIFTAPPGGTYTARIPAGIADGTPETVSIRTDIPPNLQNVTASLEPWPPMRRAHLVEIYWCLAFAAVVLLVIGSVRLRLRATYFRPHSRQRYRI